LIHPRLDSKPDFQGENPVDYLPEKQLVVTSDDSPHDLSGLDDQILQDVFKHIGVRYKRGESTKSGVDCSGFGRLIYRHIFHVDLPKLKKGRHQTKIT